MGEYADLSLEEGYDWTNLFEEASTQPLKTRKQPRTKRILPRGLQKHRDWEFRECLGQHTLIGLLLRPFR